MAEGRDQEKTEKPTGKKLDEARKKGQVPKSPEVSTTFILLGALGVLFFGGSWMFSSLSNFMQAIFQNLGTLDISVTSAGPFLAEVFQSVFVILVPIFVVTLVAGVGANLLQIGFLFTLEPFIPKLSKFNPISGMKKFVSLRALVDLLKSVIKVTIIGWIAYLVVKREVDILPSLLQMSVADILSFIGSTSLKIIFFVTLAMIVLAVSDFVYQRWQHTKDLMMTKQEVKDDHKQVEGDPQVKGRIRKAQREMAMKRMMAAIPEADVIITNPTSLAIAVKYDAKEMFAPQVVAKGAGFVAEKIKEIARENEVPIVENRPLAQTLYKGIEIGAFIPASLYRAVAEVLAYVYRLKGGRPS